MVFPGKKKRNPELQQDFQLSIAVTPLRSSTHEELCASPAAVLVAPRWHTGCYTRQGAPMGVSRAPSMGRALLRAGTHGRATSEKTRSSDSPQLHSPAAASRAGCPCTAAPCSPRCNPGFFSFFIYFFFLLFFPRAAAWPGTASPAQREDCTLRRNSVGDVQRWLATASTGEPPFSPLMLFSLSLPIYTCPRTELLQRSFFTTQITSLSTASLLCLNCCYAEVPWALLVFLLFFFFK